MFSKKLNVETAQKKNNKIVNNIFRTRGLKTNINKKYANVCVNDTKSCSLFH